MSHTSLEIDLVNLGTYPNDGTGDDLRTAFEKSNANFVEIRDKVVLSATNLGTGAPVWVDKVQNDLRFRSFKSPTAPDIKEKMTISYDSHNITLSVVAIADLIEDTSPQLGGDLDLNNFNITGSGDILITGNISADVITANTRFFGNLTGDVLSSGLSIFALIDINSGTIDNTLIGSVAPNIITGTTVTANDGFFGDLTGDIKSSNGTVVLNSGTTGNDALFIGDVIGNVTGNLTGNSFGLHTGPVIGNVTGNLTGNSFGLHTGDVIGNVTGNLTGNVTGNVTGNLTGNVTGNVTGNSFGTHTGPVIGNVTGNLTGDVTGNSFGTHTGPVIGNVTGSVTGNLTGSVTGNVIGQVSDISNHSLSELNNVSNSLPSVGQALVWSGADWSPQTITTGVSKIVAGTNVTISPVSGLGEVTINASGGESGIPPGFDFGNVQSPTNIFELLIQATPIDFGTLIQPGSLILDLGLLESGPVPTYQLNPTALTTSEGNVITIELVTTNVANGTVIPYTISGVSSSDINGTSLTGSFVINSGSDSIIIPITVDLETETETLTLTLDGIVPVVSVSIVISDYVLPTVLNGGSPGTTVFEISLDGGLPSSVTFEEILDGSVLAALEKAVIDGGIPGSVNITTILEGGTPSSIPTVVVEGGAV